MKGGDYIYIRTEWLGRNQWYIKSIIDYTDRYGKPAKQAVLNPVVKGEIQDVEVELDTRTIEEVRVD
jgi:lysozyme family protein